MSHLVKQMDIYLELYRQQQAAIAGRLHSDLAQPVVAAKNFAAAIMSIQGEGEGLAEARELAEVILEMTDQAYTVAYDLMRENEPDVDVDSCGSLQSAIERYGILLRLSKRGIELAVVEELSSMSIDNFLQALVLDWVKTLLVYLARHEDVSAISVKLTGSEVGLMIDVVPDIELNSDRLEAEIVLANIRKQLEILDGTLSVSNASGQTVLRVVMPSTCRMLTVIK